MPQLAATLIQITDTHIYDQEDGELGGINTLNSLRAVLSHINDNFRDADLVVLSGDNTHESTEQAYLRLAQELATLPMPYVFLPGNHDHEQYYPHLQTNQQHIDEDDADEFALEKFISLGGWNVFLLDSHVEHEVNGQLAAEEIDFVKQILSYSNEPAIAFVHHHLLPINCAWLDKQKVSNAADLFQVLNGSPVQAIFNGHVHQQWQGEYAGIQLHSTPSTCMQFKPDSDNYAEDDLDPGYRWIKLFDDGSFETDIVRVSLN